MADGQLTAPGLKNLTALGNLITWQKLDLGELFHKYPLGFLKEKTLVLDSDEEDI